MKVPSTKVQNNFGKYLKFVAANEEIIVTKKGRNVARIVPFSDPEADRIKEEAAQYKASSDWVSYEEFLELTEESEQRFELIDGVVYNLVSPTYKHQHIVSELLVPFYTWFKGMQCVPLTSPFDITFFKEEDNICVVQPDLIVVCDKENLNEKDKYMGIPSLVVEVLSPSTRSKDMLKKLELYKDCGVHEYWIVDPINEQIQAFTFQDQEIADSKTYVNHAHLTAQSGYFVGLEVNLQDIFS